MPYTDLTTPERIQYHDDLIRLHKRLRQLNHRYGEALTPGERAALRAEAAPLLQQANQISPDDYAGTIPEPPRE